VVRHIDKRWGECGMGSQKKCCAVARSFFDMGEVEDRNDSYNGILGLIGWQKKDESRLCRLVFHWSPSFKIWSIRVTITTKTL